MEKELQTIIIPNALWERKLLNDLAQAHVGLGSNVSFGGNRKGKHIDLVFGPATVIIDDEKIVVEGKINKTRLGAFLITLLFL